MFSVSSISGKTTSTELSSFTYKHLCRSVPSDKFLAKAMVDLITHFNWGYVAVVGLDDSYGRSGACECDRNCDSNVLHVRSSCYITLSGCPLQLLE